MAIKNERLEDSSTGRGPISSRRELPGSKSAITFWDFARMGQPHWRGQTSALKAAFFFLLGSPDTHTRLRNSYVLNEIEKLPLPSYSRVLEGGCGRAIPLFWLARRHPEWQFTGIELDPVLAQSAQRVVQRGRWSNVAIIEGDVLDLNEETTFDLVISIDILEHIQDDVGLLRRYWRALKPGGYLVIHVPRRHQEMWRWLPVFRRHGVVGHVRQGYAGGHQRQVVIEGHVREEYTAEEVRRVAEQAGFRIYRWRETIGRWGEISFELNNLFWTRRAWRYLLALLTYPIAIPLGYLDVRRNPDKGNSLLLIAQRE